MNNKGLLTVIAVVLIGIIAIFLIHSNEAETAEPSMESPKIKIYHNGTASYVED